MKRANNAQEVGKRILEAIKERKLSAPGKCQYSDLRGKNCAVGLLLPKKMLQSIKVKGLNESPVCMLQEEGINCMQYFPGLNLQEVTRIQDAFDNTKKATFVKIVTEVCRMEQCLKPPLKSTKN